MIQPEPTPRPMDTSLKARMAPHLGLLTIARIIEDAGHEVSVVNESLGRDVPSSDVDLVGISASVDVLPRAKALAVEYERLNIPVVVGGIGVSEACRLIRKRLKNSLIPSASDRRRDIGRKS